MQLFLIFCITISVTFVTTNDTDLTENEKYLLYKIEQLQQHFERNVTDLNNKIIDLENSANKSSNACEKGWFAYLDKKCIKVVEKKGTESEAEANCQLEDNSAHLLSIHSAHELQFISNELSKYNNIADNVWIGLKYMDKAFKWLDKTDFDYNNWDSDAKRDGALPCVQMSLGKSSLGKWKDELCDRKNLMVCQTKQTTITVFAEDLKNVTKVVNEMQNTINTQKAVIEKQRTDFTAQIAKETNDKTELSNQIIQQKNEIATLKQLSIPIGFLYTQPCQSGVWSGFGNTICSQVKLADAPPQLWPQAKWEDVTAQYTRNQAVRIWIRTG